VSRASASAATSCCTVQTQHEKSRKRMLRNIFSPIGTVPPDFRRLQALLHCAILRSIRTE
jgi:hypothetical protein